ncbi:MAG TPA: uroporphyrinogen-III synthase [Casimicrobiaceae bacterium]|nr:uroporphyrinogen-III synthase [Casimicrobiaceae bacterium]
MSEVSSGSMGPLHGLGVIITRPARQSAAISTQLAALGARPIVWPAIVILPPDDPAALARVHAELDHYDIAIFVSANAAEFGAPDPARWPRTLQTFAPGPGTVEALAAVGIRGAIMPAVSLDSEGLLALPELRSVEGKRVAIFRGQEGRELLGATLRERGAHVQYVECYRRSAPSGDATGLLDIVRERRAHALSLTSVEGLENLVAAVGTEGLRFFASLKTFAPHRRIVAAARQRGLDAVETGPGDGGLIAALLEFAAARRA